MLGFFGGVFPPECWEIISTKLFLEPNFFVYFLPFCFFFFASRQISSFWNQRVPKITKYFFWIFFVGKSVKKHTPMSQNGKKSTAFLSPLQQKCPHSHKLQFCLQFHNSRNFHKASDIPPSPLQWKFFWTIKNDVWLLGSELFPPIEKAFGNSMLMKPEVQACKCSWVLLGAGYYLSSDSD